MKKAISFILALITLISLTGCGGDKKPADGNSSVSVSHDLNDDQNYLGSSIERKIAEGPDAYYFFQMNIYTI